MIVEGVGEITMKKEILVVDDQPGIRLLLADMLKNEGYAVETAETGQEALDRINMNPYDLLILDYQLPIINGIELLLQLEKRGIHLPAILISGLAEEFSNLYDSEVYVKKIFTKPFNLSDISLTVQTLLA